MDPRLQLMQAQMMIEQKRKQLAEKTKKGGNASKSKNAPKDTSDKKALEKSKEEPSIGRLKTEIINAPQPAASEVKEQKKIKPETKKQAEFNTQNENNRTIEQNIKQHDKSNVKENNISSDKIPLPSTINQNREAKNVKQIEMKHEDINNKVASSNIPKYSKEEAKLIHQKADKVPVQSEPIVTKLSVSNAEEPRIVASAKFIISYEELPLATNEERHPETLESQAAPEEVHEAKSFTFNTQATASENLCSNKSRSKDAKVHSGANEDAGREISGVLRQVKLLEEPVASESRSEVLEIRMDLEAQMRRLQQKKSRECDRKREEAMRIKKQLLERLTSKELDTSNEAKALTFADKELAEYLNDVQEDGGRISEDEVCKEETVLPFIETINEVAAQLEIKEELDKAVENQELLDTAHFNGFDELVYEIEEDSKEDAVPRRNAMTFGKQSESSELLALGAAEQINDSSKEQTEEENKLHVMDFGDASSQEKKKKHFEALRKRQARREEERLNQRARAKEAATPPDSQVLKAPAKRTPSNDLYLCPQVKVAPKEEKKLFPKPETPKLAKVAKECKGKRTPVFSKPCNHQLMKNAIATLCLAGEPNKKRRTEALDALSTIDNTKNAIVLFKEAAGTRQDFKALYSYTEEEGMLRLVYGGKDVPTVIEQEMVYDFYKYDSGAKEFRRIAGNKSFSIAVDAVSLRPSLTKKKSNLDKVI
eukprot:TRINITY_DN982_c0_g2_i4.p1 TRINITY_DN982_c0_g2~~TRINITY_DN982_c0_g2_i4.p1  ORF type:complete len:712 (-),score=194.84 TRINITY_DN982_c0_g2_i4:75-2210(-)